ncbi:hypothetical protein [Mucilaginibacter paludis]|uniref:Uncharacterized protein n=1 Tax=Mucilaginibacter paludis DSM 18603 TaxID=714943 RepID=H1Y0P2_9SPHI|nr:hypothetical protein [Mucilaginibacter paludis]EHQ28782.1 hypothetical protein Mucpa_4697 [Mucilaginibacter paludis DSM 18603]
MDNLNDLKKIWLTADTSGLPNADEIVVIIKNYRSQKLIKKALLVATALLLTATMVLIVFKYRPVMLSTRIGEACIIAAGVMLIYTNTYSLSRIYKLRNCTNKEFIKHLEQAHANRIFYHQKTQVAGLLLTSLGLLLYEFELVYLNLAVCIAAYLAMVVWLLIVWLVIRPRAFKKQQEKFNSTLKKIETLTKQL